MKGTVKIVCWFCRWDGFVDLTASMPDRVKCFEPRYLTCPRFPSSKLRMASKRHADARGLTSERICGAQFYRILDLRRLICDETDCEVDPLTGLIKIASRAFSKPLDCRVQQFVRLSQSLGVLQRSSLTSPASWDVTSVVSCSFRGGEGRPDLEWQRICSYCKARKSVPIPATSQHSRMFRTPLRDSIREIAKNIADQSALKGLQARRCASDFVKQANRAGTHDSKAAPLHFGSGKMFVPNMGLAHTISSSD
jgi:hypothetical protein